MTTGSYFEDAEERVSEGFLKVMIECADNHAPGCPCRYGGDVILPEIVIESNEGYVVVAEVAPDV